MHDTVCLMPWISIITLPQGQIGPCCVFDDSHDFGNIKTHKLQDAVNHTSMKQLRIDMLKGHRNSACSTCWRSEDQGLVSIRQRLNSKYKKHFPIIRQTALDGTLDNFQLIHADFRISNLCNLKCRMCTGAYSSSIAQEEATLFNQRRYIDIKINNQEFDKVLDFFSQHINSVESLYFAGGEPLLLEAHYKMLDLIIKHNRTDVELSYNTNLTNLKFKNQSVTDYWKHFDNVIVGVSVDLTDQRAAYVRHGSDYQVIKQNYRSIAPYVKINISSVLSLYNAFNLIELQKDWILNEKVSASSIGFMTLVNPDFLSIQILPKFFKDQIFTEINQHIKWLKTVPESDQLIIDWQNAQNFMMLEDHSDLLDTFFEVNDLKDQYRNESFERVFPEFQNLRSYCNFLV